MVTLVLAVMVRYVALRKGALWRDLVRQLRRGAVRYGSFGFVKLRYGELWQLRHVKFS